MRGRGTAVFGRLYGMRFRFALPLLFALFLLSTPRAGAFFKELEELQRRLERSQPSSTLDSLAKEIGKGSFVDVDARAWYAPYVITMARKNIVSGDADPNGMPRGTFRPGDNVTVAEALKVVFRAAGVHEEACTAAPANWFAGSHWSENFVACAEGLGVRIIKTDTLLDRSITRAELLALIDDVFAETVPSILPPFRDTVGHAYASDVAFNAKLKIVSGDTDALGRAVGTFRPDDALQRAEIVKIIARKLETRGM